MDNEIRPEDLCAHLNSSPRRGLNVVWVVVAERRDQFKTALDDLLKDMPALVICVRSRGFDDPNALLADFVNLLEDSRSYCEDRLATFPQATSLDVVLLAKKQLSIPQASSPVMLPPWLPVMPGHSVEGVVRDLSWTVQAPVNDARTGVPLTNEALFALERAAIRRMRSQLAVDPRCGDSFVGSLGEPPGANFEKCLELFSETHSRVANPSAFRPSLREGNSLVAQLWRLLTENGTEKIGRPASSVSKALGVSDAQASSWSIGFVGLLFRPSNPPSSSRAFAVDVVATVGFACQLTTAAAHSDTYPQYPIPLLTAFGQSLRVTLGNAIQFLDSLE